MTDPLTPGWRSVRRGASRRMLEEASLVLTAMEIDNRIEQAEFDWCLRVPDALAANAVRQLENFSLENHGVDVRPTPPATIDSGWWGVCGFLLVIWLLPALEAQHAFGWQWREIGSLQAGLVEAGQWWRTLTALTLHADFPHILGNSAFGAAFGVFVGRYLGSGVGWLCILLAGALGNGFNAWLRPDEFRSIGASTATFAALSIGGAFVWRRGYFAGRGWRRAFAPIFAGIAILAFTGMGGGNTDVVAHIAGFAAGVAMGIAAAEFRLEQVSPATQWVCGLFALMLVASAWIAAGSHLAV